MGWKSEIEKMLTEFVGTDVTINDFSSVGGGSINETYKVKTNEGDFFVKKNSVSLYPQMFEKEVRGLQILRATNEIDTPEIIDIGESGNDSFLILKFINTGEKPVHSGMILEDKLPDCTNILIATLGSIIITILGHYINTIISMIIGVIFLGKRGLSDR